MPYSDIIRQKAQSTISFLSNEHNVPPLPNVCPSILSNVCDSRLYQHKLACNNVKLVNVHASPIYTSSVGQLIKPSTASKLVLSNNVCNVHNVSSISQILKTFNATKSVCSRNASNFAICNSTCEPVFNFASDCQSVKPTHKLIDVNQKHIHERLVNNKSSHQPDFTKPFSAMNVLIRPYIFYISS